MLVYTLLDRKLKEFGPPVIARNDETIRRSVVDGVRGSKSLQELHGEDFDLFCVGEFDVDTGVLKPQPVRLVANLLEIVEAYAAR